MTNIEKTEMIKNLLGINDDSHDALIGAYLTASLNEIVNWRYRLSTNPDILKFTDSADNTATLSAGSFISMVQPEGYSTHTFTYDSDTEMWIYSDTELTDIADYGIVLENDPVDGEIVTVRYVPSLLSKYDTIQVMACVIGFNLNGAEGQTSHNENGTDRGYKYSDMIDYIHAHVPQIAGVA